MPWSPLRRAVVFDASVFHARVRLTVLAHDLAWRHAELQAGGQLWIRANTADLTGTEFLRGSILANPGHDTALPDRSDPGPKPADFDQLPLRDRAKYEARRAGHDLATRLAAQPPVAARVVSLRQANVAELVLSAVSLEECWFAGAHGLDKLRIDASCALPDSPAGWRRRRPFRFTDRRCLAEEAAWRHRHATWSATPDREEAGDPPPAMEIAGIYRDLRKGLEDIKNEPGAADFYYGEMEMRRLAARERDRAIQGEANRERAGGGSSRPSRAERWLLHAYWAVSGYGLRASRAFLTLVATLLLATSVFTTVGIASSPQADPRPRRVNLATGEIIYQRGPEPDHSIGTAAEFAVRDSIALLRTPTPAPPLTAAGKVTAVLLRLLAPLLLALALLAVRGRTKR